MVELKKRVNELLVLVGLESAADKSARNYSGGMKKRLDLATALVHEPKLLFLDEPTPGLIHNLALQYGVICKS